MIEADLNKPTAGRWPHEMGTIRLSITVCGESYKAASGDWTAKLFLNSTEIIYVFIGDCRQAQRQ